VLKENEMKNMLHCTPFLLFDGKCAEAVKFYQKCLGGELTLTKLGETPMKTQFPLEKHHKIVNTHLKSGAVEFSATDWLHPTKIPKKGNWHICNRWKVQRAEKVFHKLSGEQTKRDSLNCMICHLGAMDN
jgi:uncharacterized glyoxalase superfamily protein PhnB